MLSSLTPRQFRIIIALLVILAVVLIALIAIQLNGSDDSATATTVPIAGTTTFPTPPTTVTSTTAPTTTSQGTTTTSAATTTTEASTTTLAETTTTSEATTTTAPPPADLILQADGLEVVAFGTGPDVTIATVTAAIGESPDVDTGWLDFFDNPYGTCPPPEIRGVEWGILVVLFTKAETDFASQGTEHFFSYTYAPQPSKPGAGPHGLVTAEGIGLGSSRSQLEAAYGSRVTIIDDDVFGSFFQIDVDFESDTALGGTLTGSESSDLVASILGGVGCGE